MKLWEYVFYLCLLLFCISGAYYAGRMDRPKVCAQIPGLTPLSSTADSCTYGRDWGMAKYKRKAI